MTKLNGVQRGAEVSKSFQTWFDERQKLGDVSEYLNARGRLNKSSIAVELGFARSNFNTNPALKEALEIAEETLCAASNLVDVAKPLREANAARERANDKAKLSSAESSRLMERIVSLEAENRNLKNRLAQLELREKASQDFNLLAEALEKMHEDSNQ
ncbi:hypothetical protein [uncultured Cohaesibacter sp.]|uniref:hypothetical protein n=1 Tax=uncultured Cohaesibacter sp. TaxID=1002546 RepID=UPI0029C7E91E|nr:hypothetical protein [uncultured Cohaesibacter sp.]